MDIRIRNCTTGEETVRPMTAEEVAQRETEQATEETKVLAKEATNVIKVSAEPAISLIPGWSTYSADEATDWIDANVSNLEDAKNVLKKLAKMVCALRDDRFPHLRANG